MSLIVQLPYYPLEILRGEKRLFQIDRINQLLSRVKKKGFLTGVQIFMGGNDKLLHYFDEYTPQGVFPRMRDAFGEETMKNSSLHLPLACSVPASELNLGNLESIKFFSGILSSAKDYNLRTAILHTNTVYYQPTPENLRDLTKGDFIWNEGARQESRKFVEGAIRLAEKFPEITFCYETMPFPISEDLQTDLSLTIVEPNLITSQSLEDFLRDTDGKNIGLCLDTAHYLITRETLKKLERNPQWLKQNKYLRILIGALSQKAGEKIIPDSKRSYEILANLKMPSLSEFIRRNIARITDVQIADTSGAWIPAIKGMSGELVQEGLSLVKGINFYDEIMYSFSLIRSSAEKRNISVSFDVAEEDYKKRENQEKTLETVLGI